MQFPSLTVPQLHTDPEGDAMKRTGGLAALALVTIAGLAPATAL